MCLGGWRSNSNRRAGDLGVLASRALVTTNVTTAIVFAQIVGCPLLRTCFSTEQSRVLGSPGRNLPGPPSKGLDLESSLLPFPARLRCTIKRTQLLIDDTLVGFGAEFVSSC